MMHRWARAWGFVPPSEALSVPPIDLKPYHDLADDPSGLKNIQKFYSSLPSFDPSILKSYRREELELTCLTFGILTHSYYWQFEEPSIFIPPVLSVPFSEVCQVLGRPKVLTIASLQFYNWKFINENKEFHPSNLKNVLTLSKTRGEENFYNIATYIEYLGASYIKSVMDILKNEENIPEELPLMKTTLVKMCKALSLMFSSLDPHEFYYGFRKKIRSFDKGIVFQGVSDDLLYLCGPSAMQSPIIRFIDQSLGIKQNDDLYERMIDYYTVEHREFLETFPHNPTLIRDYCLRNSLTHEWNDIINQLIVFRKIHMKLVDVFIKGPSGMKDTTGTGSSSIDEFLTGYMLNSSKQMILG